MMGISPAGSHSGMRTPGAPINSPNIGGETKGNSPSPAYNPISPSYPQGVASGGTPNLADPLGHGGVGGAGVTPAGAAYCPNTPAYSVNHSKTKK